MKKIHYILGLLAGAWAFTACSDDDKAIGNPVMNPQTEFSTALFGDSLPFRVSASDADVPLSTLKAQLFYGDDMVSETVIRTKTNDDYSGKIYVPFYANVPNARATFKLLLQNINFAITEKEYILPLSRPDYPYLTLVTDEDEYQMERVDLYQYAVTKNFPQKLKGYIKAPKVGENGNEITFGWASAGIIEGSTSAISFSNSNAGKYAIEFNTYTYEASPFVKLLVDGEEMEVVDGDNYKIDLTLSTGQMIEITGIPNFDEWEIDPDFFAKGETGKLEFLPMGGTYRVIANFKHEYIFAETLSNGEPATLQEDGTGAIWVIGEQVGKPSVAANAVGWVTEKALCMAPVSKGVYQITLVGGKSVGTNNINFKFFHQKGWGGEFEQKFITSQSDIVVIPKEDGNLAIAEGKALDAMGIYVFKVDVTAGIENAVLTVTKAGEEVPPTFEATLDGTAMEMVGADLYKVEKELAQNQKIRVAGIPDLSKWWIDPDFFTLEGSELTFLPLAGKYRITANNALKYFVVETMNGNDFATLNADGSGAIWIIGDDIGKPSIDNKIGWNTDKALCMAPYAPKKYRITVVADKHISTNSINFKFFHQKGWGGEFGSNAISTNSDLVFIGLGDDINGRGDGNLGVAPDKSFEEDGVYVFSLDLTQGNTNAVLTVTKE